MAADNPVKNDGEIEGLLAGGSLFIFAAALGCVLFSVVPASNEKYVMLLLGALIGVVKDTFGRYFQATKGAQEQRKDFADLAIRAAALPTADPVHTIIDNTVENAVPVTPPATDVGFMEVPVK